MSITNNKWSIYGIPVLEDNIIWIWFRENEAVVIDPSNTRPVIEWLEAKHLKLIGILQTHHHLDHIGGTKGLLEYWPQANVYASKADLTRIPFQTISVKEKDEFELLGGQIKVLEVPGHTKTHLAFYVPQTKEEESTPLLFCGDTLFAAGCGRLFEGTASEMYKAIQRLKCLPDETEVYCAHEYTEANLRWANSIHPENLAIKNRLQKVIKLRANGLSTLPTTISEEKETNLFIRSKNLDEFTYLRNHKDNW